MTNKHVLMFSYGSGLCASIYFLKIKKPIQHLEDLRLKLNNRIKIPCEEYD